MNRSFFLSLAAARTRSSDWVMRARPCVRCMRRCSAFPLVPSLGSTHSSAGNPALFVGFSATMPESDFSVSCISGYGSSPSRCGPYPRRRKVADPEISRFPYKELPCMPGSTTTPGWTGARVCALAHVAFRSLDSVDARDNTVSRLNGWPACSPTDASPTPSRRPAHGSGPMWFATPSSQWTFTIYSLPVSRRTQSSAKTPAPSVHS
ncbi:hypothetical protein ACVIHI_008378 [Bradyrhizobium sp. USDA 4524]|nr:hypothetical protein [Bradyrhizobium sp. USDA 4538]MCP1899263.1 hypothetical protein [Bradyrhizobium sp. USDA 4537]MCP1986625.1 hypothetical protein [Bradyrhizobium sp. USDA 4539]